MYSGEGLLGVQNEKDVVSIFYLGRAQLLLLFILFVHRGQTPATQPGAPLSPASGLTKRGAEASEVVQVMPHVVEGPLGSAESQELCIQGRN